MFNIPICRKMCHEWELPSVPALREGCSLHLKDALLWHLTSKSGHRNFGEEILKRWMKQTEFDHDTAIFTSTSLAKTS